ncbi:WecB/TagA/CpsF family glycosyltransferase [Gemmobacter denitrificans]|uniref:WecB/TagA/CpsF family glycosyltransferase n=1 Tax=Gemmobacter denitrificans TaxID=3123040 RepID=A0ABU8BSV9_9RHOB
MVWTRTSQPQGRIVQFQFDTTTISVNVPHAAALLAAAKARLAEGRGFALATINLDHLVKLGQDPAFRTAYAAQDFVVADGNPIVWLSRLARRPVQLVPGSEMVLPLARIAAQTGARIALLGGTEASLAAAAARMQAEIPALQIALQIAPPMGFDVEGVDATAMLRQLDAEGIGLCFLALGAPKQEIMAARGRKLAPRTGFASIGAGLDFLAGSQTRAPEWAQKIAMEWAWRMMSNPRRLVPRYWACAKLLPSQVMQALRMR